jgi:uncharacterized membrane protein YcaP (DUF421 family)
MGFDINLKFLPLFVSFLTLIFLFYFIAYISYKSESFRKLIGGKPTLIVENGETVNPNMRKVGLTQDILYQQLREQGIFDIKKVKTALLEANGKLSVLKQENDKQQNATAKTLPAEVIVAGKVLSDNLTDEYDRSWLLKQCSKNGVGIDQIRYGVIGSDGTLYTIQNDTQPS